MLTFQIRKQRHEKTLIGYLQSKWKKALKKLGKTSLETMSIALATIMILCTLTILLFINMQNPQTSKQRNLKSGDPTLLPPPPLCTMAYPLTANALPPSAIPTSSAHPPSAAPLPLSPPPPVIKAEFQIFDDEIHYKSNVQYHVHPIIEDSFRCTEFKKSPKAKKGGVKVRIKQAVNCQLTHYPGGPECCYNVKVVNNGENTWLCTAILNPGKAPMPAQPSLPMSISTNATPIPTQQSMTAPAASELHMHVTPQQPQTDEQTSDADAAAGDRGLPCCDFAAEQGAQSGEQLHAFPDQLWRSLRRFVIPEYRMYNQ